MTKSSIDTFDPQGMMRREEPITSLKDDASRPKNSSSGQKSFSCDRDERYLESQAKPIILD